MLQEIKVKVRGEQDVEEHYTEDGSATIMQINDTKGSLNLSRVVMLRIKWTA